MDGREKTYVLRGEMNGRIVAIRSVRAPQCACGIRGLCHCDTPSSVTMRQVVATSLGARTIRHSLNLAATLLTVRVNEICLEVLFSSNT